MKQVVLKFRTSIAKCIRFLIVLSCDFKYKLIKKCMHVVLYNCEYHINGMGLLCFLNEQITDAEAL